MTAPREITLDGKQLGRGRYDVLEHCLALVCSNKKQREAAAKCLVVLGIKPAEVKKDRFDVLPLYREGKDLKIVVNTNDEVSMEYVDER